jgi:hypothetical protein
MTRHYLFILTIWLVWTSCSDQTTEKTPPNGTGRDSSSVNSFPADTSSLFSLSNVTADEFSKAKNSFKDKILYDSTTLRKKSDTLKIPTDNKIKPFVIFTDTLPNTDETEIRDYQYFGQFPEIGVYIAHLDYYEGSEFILIDKHTGMQTSVWNKPKLSPNDKFIANLSPSYGMEGVPNGIQVWRVNKNGQRISKYIEIDQLVWVPYDFYWETESSLVLHVNSVEKFLEGDGRLKKEGRHFLRLTIK